MVEVKGIEIWYGEALKPLLGEHGGAASALSGLIESLRAQLADRYQIDLRPVTVAPDERMMPRRIEVMAGVGREASFEGVWEHWRIDGSYIGHSYLPERISEQHVGGRTLLSFDVPDSLPSERLLAIINERISAAVLEEALRLTVPNPLGDDGSTFTIEA